jgi:cardiolipin synthase
MEFESFIDLLKPHLYLIVSYLVIIFALLHLLKERKRPVSISAWVLLFIVAPYAAVILYFLLSGRKLRRIKKLKTSVDRSMITRNSSFYLCKDGVEGYYELMELLKEAKESIYISTYIFANDELTKEIVGILEEKVKNGVEVKLLMDWVGSFSLDFDSKLLSGFENYGGEYRFFGSMRKNWFYSKLNLRLHRKMVIVDKRRVLSGGINLAKEYLFRDKRGLWNDITFISSGDSVLKYLEIFFSDWNYAGGKTAVYNDFDKIEFKERFGDALLEVVPSGPDVEIDILYEMLIQKIFESKREIFIVSSYFTPDSTISDALIFALHRGVEVNIMVPKISDHLLVDIARTPFLRELQSEGANIYLFKSGMLHAKLFMSDRNFAILGSANFDNRSFFYNFEVVVAVYGIRDVKIVRNWIDRQLVECEKGLEEVTKVRLALENLFKVAAPLL